MMNKDAIRWSDAPPAVEESFIPILSPRPGGSVKAISLSSWIRGVWTHYAAERTFPCTAPPEECLGCRAKLARRWKGYLAGLEPPRGRIVLVELTKLSVARAAILLESVGDLRGQLVTLRRNGRNRNAPVTLEVRHYCLPNDNTLPAEFDVKAALLRIWGRCEDAAIAAGELPVPVATLTGQRDGEQLG